MPSTSPEDVGVAADELLVEAAADVVDVEGALVGGDLRLQQDLLEKVAELLAQMRVVALGDGVHGLVGLADEVARDGLVGLRPVPGAAVGLAQPPDHADDALELLVAAGRAGAGKGLPVDPLRPEPHRRRLGARRGRRAHALLARGALGARVLLYLVVYRHASLQGSAFRSSA